MAELTIPPLLAHTPEPSPPGRWRILFLPALMAILGILIATAAATAGQDTRRARETLQLQTDLLYWQNALTDAKLSGATPDKIQEISDTLDRVKKNSLSPYSQYGRHFTQWDGARYEEIAEEGYIYHYPNDSFDVKRDPRIFRPGMPEPRLKNVTWYPLFPILGWSLSKTFGVSIATGLTIISQLSIVLASVMLFLYARRHYYNRMPKLQLGDTATLHPSRRWDLRPEDSAALWAVAALLYGPCSIFLYANFTESLFVLLLVAFLYCMQSRFWWRTAVIAAVASATRSQGALFGPILAIVFMLRSDVRNPFAKVSIAAALGVASAVGIAVYMFYLNAMFGDPLAFVHAQTAWNVGLNARNIFHALNPVNAISNIAKYAVYVVPMDWPRLWEALCVIWPPIMLLVLGGRFLSFELELVGWLLWGLPFLASSLAGNPMGDSQWMSMGRFMSVLIPAHIIIGAVFVRFRWMGVPFLAGWAATFGVFAYKFGAGEWIG